MDYKLLIQTIFGNRNQILVVVDSNGIVTYLNDPRRSVFESDPKYAIGKNITDIFDDIDFEGSPLYEALSSHKTNINKVRSLKTLKGNKVTYLSSAFPMVVNNEIVGAIEIFEDINYFLKMSREINYQQSNCGESMYDKLDFNSNGTVYSLGDIIGISPNIKELKKKIFKIADSNASILIYGETGTGKELIAQAIHNASYKRRKKPFIAQNCAAIPKDLLESTLFGTTAGSFTDALEKPGLFELADGGTLLLDEINSMDITLQAKLLRVLQEGTIRKIGDVKSKKVDVRIIAITNMNPMDAVKNGILRQDLYYRLNVISFNVLPLRERTEDLEPLVSYFLEKYNEIQEMGNFEISKACLLVLSKYNWPGNIRELKYMLENIISFSENEIIDVEDLPEHVKTYKNSAHNTSSISDGKKPEVAIPLLNEAVDLVERDLVIAALNKADGNKTEAARLLGVPRQTLNNKIKKHSILIRHHTVWQE